MSAIWIRLRRNWFRNLLAVLQVAIAIAAISAAMVDVFPALWMEDDDDATIYVARFGVEDGVRAFWVSEFHPEDVSYLLEHSTTVEAASAFANEFHSVVAVDGERWVIRGKARVNPAFAELVGLEMVAGTFFTERDALGSTPRVAVVSDRLATALFGRVNVIGETVNLRPPQENMVLSGGFSASFLAEAMAMPGDDVEIIGVFKTDDEWSLTMPGMLGGPTELLLPFSGDDTQAPGGFVSEILFRPRQGMDREAEEEVRRLLMSRLAQRDVGHSVPEGATLDVIVDPVTDVEQMRQVRLSSSLLLVGLGLAALVVSSIAMFTTTLTNLAPRTRYIGLSRALGATRSRVVAEVVAESAVLAGVGGVVGVLLALPLRNTVFAPLFTEVVFRATSDFFDVLLAGVTGVALAVIVGAAAALYPAWTVARMEPADAWREGTF